MFFKSQNTNKQSGMTFLELVVVMGIFTAISSAVLFNYRDFSNSVHLQNLSQEIALQGKRAQTFASQGRRPTLSQVQYTLPLNWVSSYGLAFNKVENNKSFIFYYNSFPPEENDEDARALYFSDYSTSNFAFGCGGDVESECLEEILMTDGSKIDLICAGSEPHEGNFNCEEGESVEQAHISFTRPRLESRIMVGGNNLVPDLVVGNVFIKISSPDGSQSRFITFWNTGQISVN